MKRYKKYNDEKLLALIAASKEPEKSTAFSEIYDRYSSKVYIYLKKAFSNNTSADDIFQDTFIKFLKAVERGAEIKNVLGYLLRIARNLALNFKRDYYSEEMLEFEEYLFDSEDKTIEQMELAEVIDSVMKLLPEKHKEAFILQTYYGMSYNEIAEVTNVPVTTVRNRVVRAKSKLKELIAPVIEERN